MSDASVYIHPRALVETSTIGPGTRIWANTHIMKEVRIGQDCNICDGAFIESGVVIGRGVTIKQNVLLCEGVTVGDGVFLGPNVVFTNDLHPRSPRLPLIAQRYQDKGWLLPTVIEPGATLGANATILCGVTIGRWAMVAAGATVVHSIKPHTLYTGKPGRPLGYLCACTNRLQLEDGRATCEACGRRYAFSEGELRPEQPIALWENNLS